MRGQKGFFVIVFATTLVVSVVSSSYAMTEFIGYVPVLANVAKDTTILYTIRSDGRLIIRISNPDGSADGMFTVTVTDNTTGACISFNEFFTTGIVPWGSRFYHSNPTMGLVRADYEMSLTSRDRRTPPPPGTTVRIRVVYPWDSQFGTEHTGIDTLFLYFNDTPLWRDTVGAIFLDSLVTGPFDASYRNYSFTTECGTKLIAQVTLWGNAGGGDSYYIDGLGCGGTYTGSPCACEFYSFHIPNGPGAHTLTIAHEDDYWGDNTDYRAVKIYLVPLDPEIDSIWTSEETDCDNANIVRICYSLSNCAATVFVKASADSGRTWNVPIISVFDTAGDLGANVSPGIHCFSWILNLDYSPIEINNLMVQVVAIDTTFTLADTNLLRNPGLETPFNPLTDWSTHGTPTRSSTIVHSGSYSYYMNTTGPGQYIYQSWPLIENQSYFFECYVWLETTTYRSVVLEIVRDWNPSTGYALTSSAVSFFTPDSIQFTIWGGVDTIITGAGLTTGTWHRIGIFADVLNMRQTLYIDGRPVAILNADTSYSAQFIIVGAVSGSNVNYGRLYFDDFILTYYNISPYEHSSVGISPADSRPPRVSVSCPSTVRGGEAFSFSISIVDLFYRGEPCSIYFRGNGIYEIHTTTDTIFSWIAPNININPCTLIVIARDSFCNIGSDTCYFNIVSGSPEVTIRVENDSLTCLPTGQVHPNPMNIRAILTNSGTRQADSVFVEIVGRLECLRMISGTNPTRIYNLAPGEIDTVMWFFEINRICENLTECFTVRINSFP